MEASVDDAAIQLQVADLKRRIHEVEHNNEATAVAIQRTKRAIQRVRLERAVLLQSLEDRASIKADDSDGSLSPPDSPIQHDLVKKVRDPSDRTPVKEASKSKRTKEPKQQKKTQHPIVEFCSREASRIKAESGVNGEKEVAHALAEAWTALNAKDKKSYTTASPGAKYEPAVEELAVQVRALVEESQKQRTEGDAEDDDEGTVDEQQEDHIDDNNPTVEAGSQPSVRHLEHLQAAAVDSDTPMSELSRADDDEDDDEDTETERPAAT